MKNLNLSNIKSWFLKNKIIIVLLVLSLSLTTLYKINYDTIYNLKMENANLKADNDSIRIYKNKNNENIYKIKSLTESYDKLKLKNSDLVLEINKLSNQDKKNLVEINKLNLNINLLIDSIKKLQNQFISQDSDLISGINIYNYELKDSTEYRQINGIIKVHSSSQPKFVNTILTKDIVFTNLIIGKTLKDQTLELFVTSSNPGLTITNLEGSVINLSAYNKLEKKKRFSIGGQVGYGFTKSGFSPYVGIGISYNLINF